VGGEWRGTTKLERLKLAERKYVSDGVVGSENDERKRGKKKSITLFLSARKSSSLIQSAAGSIWPTMVVMLLISFFSCFE
jgi:hypothetical protein